MPRIETTLRRATIRTRIAILATLVASVVLLTLGPLAASLSICFALMLMLAVSERTDAIATPHTGPPAPEAAVAALALAIEAKDARTRSHCERVSAMAVQIGARLRLDDDCLEALRRAALLHDVGKIGMPDAVLQKPEHLSPEEFAVMKQHPALGYRIVRSAGLDTREALWVLHHHEFFNGSGYPHGLSGNEIPLGARIILVADAFDAITIDRPYRRARSADEAIAELRRCAGVEFDVQVVEVLASIVAERDGARFLVPEQLVASGRLA